MQINLIIQKDGVNTIESKIKENFKDAKKVYVIGGTIKETGFNIIEEELLDTDISSYFIFGIDKKNTTKMMLEAALKLTKNVYYYINNSEIEFNSNIIVIENASSAKIYFVDSISEACLRDNICEYIEIVYDLKDKEDKKEYKEKLKSIISLESDERFLVLNKQTIEKLVNDKEIFSTRQYNHTVMSISELIGKKSAEEQEVKEVEEKSNEIPKIDLDFSDIDLDIEIPEEEIVVLSKVENKKEKNDDIELEVEEENYSNLSLDEYSDEVEKTNELYDEELEDLDFDENDTLDINNLLFEKADVKLEVKKEEEKVQNDEPVLEVKKLKLNNVSNLILELPSRPSKGQDLKNIKVPNYIKQMIPEFFGFNENSKNENIDGAMYKVRDIEIEIVNAKTGEKYIDRTARIMLKQGQTYTTFTTEEMEKITYLEGDIARIIKLSDNVYHIEIIPQDINEYKIWSKVCNQNMKSSTRKFGLM